MTKPCPRHSGEPPQPVQKIMAQALHQRLWGTARAAPPARGAAKVILSRSGGAGYLDSNIGYLANMEKLLLLVARRLEKQTEERSERLEKYLQRTGRF